MQREHQGDQPSSHRGRRWTPATALRRRVGDVGVRGETRRHLGDLAPSPDEVAAAPRSMSVLADPVGMTFSVSMKAPRPQVIDEAGDTRPPVEVDGGREPTFDPAVMMSLETLAEHEGRSVVVDGDMWFGTYPIAIWWLLDGLAAIHDRGGQAGIGGPDDIEARWSTFEAATS